MVDGGARIANSRGTMKKPKSPRKTAPRKSRPRAKAKPAPRGIVAKLKDNTQKIVQQVGNLFNSVPSDVVAAIEMDHKSLRNYLGILKDTDREMGERRRAYEAFSSLLKSHTEAEQDAVYDPSMKLPGHEMHIKLAEGFVEHGVADGLMAKMDRTRDTLAWSAQANVLSESVEHHLKEEERDLLPLVRKTASARLSETMLKKFMKIREKTQKKKTKKNSGVLDAEIPQ